VAAVWYRFRAELRTRWRAWLGLALIVGLAGGAVTALTAGARRTDTAYDRFRRAQNGYDVLVSLNTAGFGEPSEEHFDPEELAQLPQVAEVAETGSFFVFIGAGVGVLVPPDERVGTEINEFKMLEGRRPDPDDPTEAVIGFALADQYDIAVGDEIEVLDPAFLVDERPPDLSAEDFDAAVEARARVLETLPDNALTVVGIEASPGEFPPQIEGTGRYLIHASPALYPRRDDIATFGEGGDQLFVRLKRGAADTDAFLAELQRLGAQVGLQITDQRESTKVVNRSVGTQSLALQLLALLTAIAGVLVIGQLLARLSFLESAEHPTLSALGMSGEERFTLGLLRAGAIGLAGAVLAVAVAVAMSPLFPTGLAGTAEPDAGVRVDATVLVLGALAVASVVVLLSAWPAWRVTRPGTRASRARSRASIAGRALAGGAPLPVSTGVRMALEPGGGQSAVPVRSGLAGVTLGVVTLVGAITFGASLAHLLATPELYGQTWDVELTTYDDALARRGVAAVEADERIDGVAVGYARGSFEVEGDRVDGLVLRSVTGGLAPAILEGRRPAAANEIALGSRTLRSIDAGVGDTVDVAPFAAERDPVPMEVVGRAVFPVFGEVGRLGEGVYVSPAGAERIDGEPVDPSDTSLLIRLDTGADLDAVVEDLEAETESFIFVISQGRPTDIVNFGRVEATPYILGGILAALSIATLTHLLVSATRRRRRELAILKTLGFVRGQVRATVGWQATTLVLVALLIGVPLGVVAGRWAWVLFADGLGVVAVPRVPVVALVVLVPCAVLIANLVAAAPAAAAARTRPALVLRSE
jgi:ABC-type lipoprotein release transport system permease subunit